MTKFHIYIEYQIDNGIKRSIWYNVTEKKLRSDLSNPFNENRSFLFEGKIIHPSQLEKLLIFSSEYDINELNLPNSKPVLGQDLGYIVRSFGEGKVDGVQLCTSDFIFPSRIVEKSKIPDMAKKSEFKKSIVRDKVFIVHGRELESALLLQKHLAKNAITADMFEDIAEKTTSNTIIEVLEYVKDNVAYAFVIATPDDLGGLNEEIEKCEKDVLLKGDISGKDIHDLLGKFKARARQNVVFEHGLFMGVLGRENVCCLLHSRTIEKPSDIDGILYVPFKESIEETFDVIKSKLKERRITN